MRLKVKLFIPRKMPSTYSMKAKEASLSTVKSVFCKWAMVVFPDSFYWQELSNTRSKSRWSKMDKIEDSRNKAKTTRRIMQDCSSDDMCSAHSSK